jgi:hypothetical protein
MLSLNPVIKLLLGFLEKITMFIKERASTLRYPLIFEEWKAAF